MAYCENCGQEMSDQATACPKCGHPARATGGAVSLGRRTEGSATASLVLGIAGLVVCPLVCSILAVIFGNQAKRKIGSDPSLDGEGMAKAGVILGWVGIGLAALGIIIVIIAAVAANHSTSGF